MILIKPSFKIEGEINGAAMLQAIERAGRTCYKSESKITSNSAEAFVKMIIERGHETVLEHEKVTVRIVCDRGVSHELVRHRIASFSQESTRYCDYTKGHITFIIPPWVNIRNGVFNNEEEIYVEGVSPDAEYWAEGILRAEAWYQRLRKAYTWKPEEARSILPNSLKTEIVITANLREWRHFFKLRTALAAHPQMREITIPMLEEFRKLIPVVFDII